MTDVLYQKRFPPVGKCIYCPDGKPPFSEEHIVPLGLGGALILPESSCEACRVMTQKFEQQVMREMIWPLRVLAGIQSKRRKPPAEVRTYAPSEGDQRPRGVTAPPDEIAIKGALPVLSQFPAIIDGRSVDDEPDLKLMLFFNKAMVEAKLAVVGPHNAAIYVNFVAFARLLAKIGHGLAVSSYGVEGFTPFLLPIIHADDLKWWRYIGKDWRADTDAHPKNAHWMEIFHRKRDGLLFMNIKLFGNFDAPAYCVVIGRLKPRWLLGTPEAPPLPSGNIPDGRDP